MKPLCKQCGDVFAVARHYAGYRICLTCGERKAQSDRRSWTVAPMAKSNYMLFTDMTLLKGLNKYAN